MNEQPYPLWRRYAALAACFLPAAPSGAVILNLTDSSVNGNVPTFYAGGDGQQHSGGVINGIYFQRSTPGSGTGQFRQLFRMSDNNDPDTIEEGYNRGGIMDSQTPNGFEPILRVQDLVQNVEGGFYMFALDANESNGGSNNYLSLDMFGIYVGGVTDPALPAASSGLNSLGQRVAGFSQGDTVLLDANTSSGSGTADMFVFVPVSAFAGFAPESLVYLYAQHGAYAAPGFGTASGFEEWASIKVPVAAMVPEPSIAAMAAGAGLSLAARRRRQHAR